MKKLFTILAVVMCSTLAMAQTNQYFWYNGNLIMGNPTNQVDSITFGQIDEIDSIMLYLPHTIKVVHDTVYVTVHDTINPCAVPEGAISGKFSVSPTKQVYFSKGNLQYQASTNTWRFAENQYDIVGFDIYGSVYERGVKSDNVNISNTYDGWIDLFGWGTGNNPTNTSTVNSNYSVFNEWGNNINSSTNNPWYTMPKEEWQYLFHLRNNATNLFALGTVNDVLGIIILPDNFSIPQGISFVSCVNNGFIYDDCVDGKCYVDRESDGHYTDNVYSITQWEDMEKAGAVFLPSPGYRDGTIVSTITYGGVWSSTPKDNDKVYDVGCGTNNIYPNGVCNRRYGRAVRLVQEVK